MSFLYLAREALRFERGIAVPCSDPNALRMQLYKERKATGEPELDLLEFRISPLSPDNELWIMPKGAK
jgi:hypothetical protein